MNYASCNSHPGGHAEEILENLAPAYTLHLSTIDSSQRRVLSMSHRPMLLCNCVSTADPNSTLSSPSLSRLGMLIFRLIPSSTLYPAVRCFRSTRGDFRDRWIILRVAQSDCYEYFSFIELFRLLILLSRYPMSFDFFIKRQNVLLKTKVLSTLKNLGHHRSHSLLIASF